MIENQSKSPDSNENKLNEDANPDDNSLIEDSENISIPISDDKNKKDETDKKNMNAEDLKLSITPEIFVWG